MTEEWRDIVGFEGYFQISNMGNIRSLDRYIEYKNGKKILRKGKNIRPVKCSNGYYEAQMSRDGKRTVMLLHRAVAQAFIPNPNNLPEVNHKDENIANNCVDNLEWCTSKYNANYGTRNQRNFEKVNKKQQKPVNQLTLSGEFIKRWDGICQASRSLGICDSQIIRVCKHKPRSETAGGFKWEYAL